MARHALSLIAALLMLLALAPAPAALARADETVADLRRENDQLRERIAQLEATLATLLEQNQALIDEPRALRSEVAELNRRVQDTSDAVEEQRATSGTPMPKPIEFEAPELAPPTDDPLASPGQLLEALIRDHDGRYPELALETADQRTRYVRDLQRWFKTLERDFTTRVEWLVDVVDSSPVVDDEGKPTGARTLVFYVIDPESNLPFDANPSTISVDSRSALRLLDNDEGVTRWRLAGIAAPTPILNTERTERGLIDTPPFIAPYVEFAYAFRVTAMLPVEVEEEDEEG